MRCLLFPALLLIACGPGVPPEPNGCDLPDGGVVTGCGTPERGSFGPPEPPPPPPPSFGFNGDPY